jgi:hypothetical protein
MEECNPASNRKSLKGIIWTVCGVVLAAGSLFVLAFADSLGFFHDPPLSLERRGSILTAHVERLGEYLSPVGRIRIQVSDSGKVVYESVAAHGIPQIFNFKLTVGENPTRLAGEESNSYTVLEPRGQSSFTLKRGIRYRLTVWGDTWTFKRANLTF